MTKNCTEDKCPVHTRTDHRGTFTAGRETSLITYIDEYAVFTHDNPEFFSATGILEALKASLGAEASPPGLFITQVLRVGLDGTLSPFADDESLWDTNEVFSVTHGDMPTEEVAEGAGSIDGINAWVDANLGTSHEMVVNNVRKGTIPSKN